MDMALSAHLLEEATNEAVYIARALGFPGADIGIEPPSRTRAEAGHLQVARRYQELGLAIGVMLDRIRG